MNREDVEREIGNVSSAVTRNRIRAIFGRCDSVDEFVSLTDAQALAKFRETKQGRDAKYDLASCTYVALAAVQANVRAMAHEQEQDRRTEARPEFWFTRDDITLAAAFMDTYKIQKIELKQLSRLLSSLVRDGQPAEEKKEA
jgi:hypothetical protein